ncbi:hypothetical protein BZARG_1997 [Bizionia argentinensis JUB59]|uniref:Uncharacterized protein n=1 Tax=Bizionia argentinensis JUB59 TaxID=1046627 RepID=G2EF63_9FLAO|nr:hypothetical protein [Bizionia argentinensis]EGV42849.1 hypothetical protein BZARG_1997 [Bizionia argentinensis JUB59]
MTSKLLITALFLVTFLNLQEVVAQNDIADLQEEIINFENKISANEEILLGGVSALKREKEALKQFKNSKYANSAQVNRKEKLASSMQQRLTKLNSQIDYYKEELGFLEKKLARKIKRNPELAQELTQNAESAGTIYDVNSSSDENKLLLQKQVLEAAREKLDDARKQREIAYLKEQEALRLEEEKLNLLGLKIKNKEQNINKEKNTLISDLEDDILINEEILISGQVGLRKMKSKLEEAKLETNVSKKSIERKEAIIFNIEERLNKIQAEIDEKLQKLKELNT